jgi:hypothetical protein
MVKSIKGIKDYMKLFWNTPFLPTSDRHLFRIGRIRISETFLEIEKLYLERNFDLVSYSSSNIMIERSRITDYKAMR